ncbi:unnamed protein product [Lymnaea stagnalis]|uniref:Uncharacterized protein n=1 Tax=Lymnaea stagnalis TaxID=6523 RepID=A0AAV2H4N7_LYMST
MYAVIVVGTVFVIAVTAALYNMCELFRKGPRPRPKGEGSREGSTTGTIHSVRSVQGNCKGNTAPGNGSQRCENLYKQMSRVDADDVTVLTDNELSSFPSRNNSHYTLTPPLPHDHQDIPDSEAITPTATPLPSSASTVTTNVATTTTPLSPKSPPSLTIGPPAISRTQQAPAAANHVV